MPNLTRSDMLIMLDSALEIFQGSQYNRLDDPLKDMWLNGAIDDFVKEVVDGANRPNPTKRLPMGVVTYSDIISKYNDINTLIVHGELTNGTLQNTIPIASVSGDGSKITFNTTNSVYHGLSIGDQVVVAGVTDGSGNWNGTWTVTDVTSSTFKVSATGQGAAVITAMTVSYLYAKEYNAYLLPKSTYDLIPISSVSGTGSVMTFNCSSIHRLSVGDTVIISDITQGTGTWNGTFVVATVPTSVQFTVAGTGGGTPTITNIKVIQSGNALYHFETSSSLVRPVDCAIFKTIPNVMPASFDISSFNQNPFGGGGKFIATAIVPCTLGLELRLYNLGRYTIQKVNVIYIKAPAKLTSTPSVVNCDLPAQVHTKIVELAARKIAAFNNNENYQPIANEIQTTE